MSWIQKLYETYEACHALDEERKARPWPVSHLVKQAHIEVVLDGEGRFRKGRARKLEWNEGATLIPATEKSAGRTAGVAPHPLCEEIGYMASDLPEQIQLQDIKNYVLSIDRFCASVPEESFTKAHAKLKDLAQSYKRWLALEECTFNSEGGEQDEEDDDKYSPKGADLEKALKSLSSDGLLPMDLQSVPDFMNKQNLRFAKKNVEYLKLLEDWCGSIYRHPKLAVVLSYLKKGSLWSDLSGEGIFPLSVKNSSGANTKVDDDKVFVRWKIEIPGEEISATWDDPQLIDAWASYDSAKNNSSGLCLVTGERSRLAQNHPRFLRFPGDGAKIISANDFSGLTFKGRFTDEKGDYEKQVCSVGFDVSQKAHNALRWLIVRQGYRSGELVVVSWAVSGHPTPSLGASSFDLFCDDPIVEKSRAVGVSDTDQLFALRLKHAIAGYGAELNPLDDVVVIAVDSATPGRMGIVFYRELKGSEFLARIEAWHAKCAWSQYFGKDRQFVGAPAPRDIAEAAYGRRLDEELSKATVERLLPCIVDGMSLPLDLVRSTTQRASNRIGFKEHWEWEKCLGIACALFKGYHTARSYQMALEQDRVSRDYLYGRLLAIAENIESRALFVAGEKRDTMAARLMQRFADRPYSTWKTIELSLVPYKSRLRTQRAGFLFGMEKLLDDVVALFRSEDFTKDSQLSGEFLLGYHCQRQVLRSGDAVNTSEKNIEETAAG